MKIIPKDDQHKIRLVVLYLSFMLMSSVPISTVYSDIAMEFSDYPESMIDLMTTVPGLSGIIALFISGVFIRYLNIKGTAVLALATIVIAGTYPVIGGGLISVIVSRSLVGVGCSILSPLVVMIIANSFSQDEQKSLMGQHAAVRAIGSMSMMILVYFIADMRWRNAFFIYFLGIPVYIALLLLLPKNYSIELKREDSEVGEDENSGFSFLKVIFYCILSFFYLVCLNTLAPFLSLYLVEAKIASGNAAGIAMCFYMAGSFMSGMAFDKIALLAKKYIMQLGMLIATAGIAFIALTAESLVYIIIGCLLQGIGYSIFNSSSVLNAIAGVKRKQRIIVILILVSTSLGGFLSPFITRWVAENYFGADVRYRYIVAVIGMCILHLLTYAYQFLCEDRNQAISVKAVQ